MFTLLIILLPMYLERIEVTFTTFCLKEGGKRREIICQTPLKPFFVEIHSQGYNT